MSSIKQIDGYKIYMNQKIGQGSFGAVYIGKNDKTGQKVAVKILAKQSIDADEYLKNALFSEIKIMEVIKSENVVAFFDVMESSKNYYIVQELCDGDLSSIMKPGKTINQSKAKQYLTQIANGFLALVRQGIIHRDVKPANIMIKGNQLKIGDFGFAKKSEAASKLKNQTIVGSPLYMSLQILKSQPYSSKCDIWALGFIYFEMLHGYTPWFGKSQYDLINKIQKTPLQIRKDISAESKDFLKKCLELNQQKRLSWDELFVHQIFNGYFINKSKGNTEFQNKLKMIMTNLRFQINSNNLDLCKILTSLGYKGGQSQLDKNKFFQFMRMVDNTISRENSDYIFNKTDYDRNGTISINQIQRILNDNNIAISTVHQKVPGFQKNINSQQSFTALSKEQEQRIKACFGKMMRQIMINKSSLKQVFNKFDNNMNGSLNKVQFRNLLKAMSKDLNDYQIQAAFSLIDADNSNSIQFNQLNTYYTKVNGIPNMEKKRTINSDQMDQQKPTYNPYSPTTHNQNYNGYNGYNQQYSNQGYQQPPANQFGFNPFSALLNQGSNGYYQQPMYQYPPPPMNYYNQPPPQQQNGMFDNFIMNQLYNSSNNGKQ